jgi:hypothetical protein
MSDESLHQQSNADLVNTIEELYRSLQQAHAEIGNLRTHYATNMATAAATTSVPIASQHTTHAAPQEHYCEVKVLLPEPFTGDKGDKQGCHDFLNQLCLIWRLQPDCYHSDSVKIRIIATLLQ